MAHPTELRIIAFWCTGMAIWCWSLVAFVGWLTADAGCVRERKEMPSWTAEGYACGIQLDGKNYAVVMMWEVA